MNIKQMQKRKILIPLFLGLIAACGGPLHMDEQELASIPAIQSELPLLGMGFSSLDASVTGSNCFTKLPIHYEKAREASLNFYRNLGFEGLSQLIDAKVEVSVPVYPGISVRGRVRFADEFAASDYTETMTVHFRAVGESSRVYFGEMDPAQPQPSLSLARLAASNDKDSIRRLCGDQFVSELNKGMELIATLKMEFSNDYERRAYGGGFGAEILGGIASVDVDVDFERMKQSMGIRINLGIQQRGGDPLQLLNILPSASELKDAGIAEEPSISFLSCSYETRQVCYEIFRRITKLAQNLSEQVKSDESETVLGNMVPLTLNVREYPSDNSMRLAALESEEAADLEARRVKLHEVRRKLLLIDQDAAEFRRRAETLLTVLEGQVALNSSAGSHGVLPVDSRVIERLERIQDKVNDTLKLVERIRLDCYSYDAIRSDLGLDICQNGSRLPNSGSHGGANGLWNRFYEGDLEIREMDMNLDPRSFTEWCALGYYPVIGNRTRSAATANPQEKLRDLPEIIDEGDFMTVQTLVKSFATVPTDLYTLRDVCKANERALVNKIKAAQGFLNLDSSSLSSVKPLASLIDITDLSLLDNRIQDVTALRDLPKLKRLNLRHNKIRSISMFRGFESSQLESLDVSRNVIGTGQLEAVIGKHDFRWPQVDLNGNVIERISTLPINTTLKKLDLRGNPLLDISGLNGWSTSSGFELRACLDRVPTCPLAPTHGTTCQLAPAVDKFCLRAD